MARILIVYSSLFGANTTLAGLAASALGATGAEVRVRRVREVALLDAVQPAVDGAKVASGDDLAWADGFVLSSQSHTGLVSASIKAFIDEHQDAAVAREVLVAHLDRFAAITDAMVALPAAGTVSGESTRRSASNRRVPTAAEVFS
jgi:multimeric flavodoxin WrbA